MTRVLAVADLHIGKGSGSIPGRVADQEDVWAQALAVGVDQGCDLVLFAGDATDRRAPSNEEREAFQRPLVGYPLPVVAINGNHDLADATKPTAIDLAGHVVGGGLLRASREPELIAVAGIIVATLPYTNPARIRTWCHDQGIDLEPDDVFAELACRVLERLAADAARLYPGVPVVNVGHYPTSGWAVPSGFETSLMRTVVLPLERIVGCGFAAAVYGDIHKGGEISSVPLVLSPGSPLPLDHGEASCEHGCYVLDVDAAGARAEFVPLVSRTFLTIDWDAADLGDVSLLGLGDVADAIVRLRYTATPDQAREIDDAAIERALLAAGAWQAKAVGHVERKSRARVTGVTADLTPLDAVQLYADAKGLDEAEAGRLAAWTTETLGAVA